MKNLKITFGITGAIEASDKDIILSCDSTNSIMENFFGLLKQEMFYGQTFMSFIELESAIHQYIDFYILMN